MFTAGIRASRCGGEAPKSKAARLQRNVEDKGQTMKAKKILILGAAGRDFHNFNVVFRGDSDYSVVGFTATQIPGIANRRYPTELAGPLYPAGIPIFEENDLEWLVAEYSIDAVVFSYSDISHQNLMHLASRVVATAADFPAHPIEIIRACDLDLRRAYRLRQEPP